MNKNSCVEEYEIPEQPDQSAAHRSTKHVIMSDVGERPRNRPLMLGGPQIEVRHTVTASSIICPTCVRLFISVVCCPRVRIVYTLRVLRHHGLHNSSLHDVFSERERECSRSLYAIARPSVCLSSVTFVRPTQGGSNFRQYFYGIRYLGHPLTSTENFTEIVPYGNPPPPRRGS